MKKTAFVLIMATVCAIIFGVSAASFVDVPADAYYADAAQRMADKGILTGYGDGYYYGGHNVTRAQMAVVACRVLDKEAEAKALAGKTAFNDVTDAHSWATGYINYAVANKIFVGDGDGNFRPDDNVKYEEAVKVIVCVLGLDKDVKIDPTDWSKEYIEAAEKANLIQKLTGKKGEAMLRSDVAVLCDASVTVLETAAETEEITTTKKSVSSSVTGGNTKPATTTKATTAETTEPEVTTVRTEEYETPITPEATTTATTRENESPILPMPAETTAWEDQFKDMLPKG